MQEKKHEVTNSRYTKDYGLPLLTIEEAARILSQDERIRYVDISDQTTVGHVKALESRYAALR